MQDEALSLCRATSILKLRRSVEEGAGRGFVYLKRKMLTLLGEKSAGSSPGR